MDTSKSPWPLSTIFGIRKRIDTNPDYQRPAVWTRSQKQLLIDTILRNYDIPKLYWRKIGKSPDKYDVVDGQQRLRAIWEFFEGAFKLIRDAEPIDEFKVAGLSYSELPDELRMRFDIYPLDIVLVTDAEEDEVREMFLRLQNGTTLKAQEKRNAYLGRMRDFVKELAGHPFFASVGFSNARFTHDLVTAQFVCLELFGGPTNVKNGDLNRVYRDNTSFDSNCSEAKAVRRILDLCASVFPEKTPELTRYNVISLYCMIAELLASYVRNQFEPLIKNWLIDFESVRRQQEKLSEDEGDIEWITYKEKISHSTDSEDSIKSRTDFMLRHFLIANADLQLKDEQREFSSQQRLAVFRRDKGFCQLKLKCDSIKLRWDDWHCDHRNPWSKGGHTTVSNGQVSCTPCNLAKGAQMPDANA